MLEEFLEAKKDKTLITKKWMIEFLYPQDNVYLRVNRDSLNEFDKKPNKYTFPVANGKGYGNNILILVKGDTNGRVKGKVTKVLKLRDDVLKSALNQGFIHFLGAVKRFYGADTKRTAANNVYVSYSEGTAYAISAKAIAERDYETIFGILRKEGFNEESVNNEAETWILVFKKDDYSVTLKVTGTRLLVTLHYKSFVIDSWTAGRNETETAKRFETMFKTMADYKTFLDRPYSEKETLIKISKAKIVNLALSNALIAEASKKHVKNRSFVDALDNNLESYVKAMYDNGARRDMKALALKFISRII